MANHFIFNDKTYSTGDSIDIMYKIKEGEKERLQKFSGMIIQIKGSTPDTRMLTCRKITRSGIGLERIIPLSSPFIASIALSKKSHFAKAKAYFVRGLSGHEVRRKIYKHS